MNGQERCYKKQLAIIVFIRDGLPDCFGSSGTTEMIR